MEFVYDRVSMWQDLMNGLMVAFPHIDTDDSDLFLDETGQVLQASDDRGFGPLAKQINDLVMSHIGNHTPILVQQVPFVDARKSHSTVLKTRLQRNGELAKKRTDGTFRQPNLIGDTHKGASQGYLLDGADQPLGHEMALVHPWKRLKEGTMASTTWK